MMDKIIYLDIPQRKNAAPTKIFVKIVTEYEDNLKTKPYIFILPGGPGGNHSHYEDYACLATHGNIVFHDPRGCGLSDKNDTVHYTMDNYIDDIEIIRQALHLEKIILLGKSFGAMAAIGFALRYPQSVSQLILSAGATSFTFLEKAKTNLLTHGTLEQQKICEKLWQGHFKSHEELDEYFKVMAPLYSYKIKHGFPSSSPPAKYPMSYEWLNNGFSGFLCNFNFEEQLHLISCPSLILVGEEDWITDKIYSQLMAKKIPHNQLIIFQKASHKMEVDVPELYFGAIKEFIN